MLKQVFRITFITFIWKHYKRFIVSSVLLFTYLWLVGFAHSEYLEFASTLQPPPDVSVSFFVKWAALIGGVVMYLLVNFLASNTISDKKEKKNATPIKEGEPDPFEHIRTRKKLRSRAEIMIEKDKQA